jgi:hypothetical protein
MVWIGVVIVLLVVAAIIAANSPSARLWADTRPGKTGAVDPTGNPTPADAAFKPPSNEGDLL